MLDSDVTLLVLAFCLSLFLVSTSPLFTLLLPVVGVPRRFCELFLFAVKFSRCALRGGLWEVGGEFKKKLALANFFYCSHF